MNGQTISWDESKPANTDNVAQGDDQIRSDKTALRVALNDEHNFPATGGANSGYHRFGSARPFVGAASAVSSSGTQGRLMYNSTDSTLWNVGASGVDFLGGPGVLQNANASGTTNAVVNKFYWVAQFGTNRTGVGGAVSGHSFSGSGFSGKPILTVTPLDADSSGAGYGTIVRVLTISQVGFQVSAEDTQSVNQSNITFNWISIGTVSSGVV